MKIELDLPEIEGYEYTGEYRRPKEDEYYKGTVDARQADSDSGSEYPILKKKAPKYLTVPSDGSIYGKQLVEIKALEDALKIISTMDAEPNLNSNEIPETKALKALIN